MAAIKTGMFATAIALLTTGCAPKSDQAFDGPAWRAGSSRGRGQMAADLIASDRLVGLSEPEVLRRLGPPAIRWDTELYSLGADSYLLIHYDRSGRVDRVVGRALPPPDASRALDLDEWRTANARKRRAMARGLTTSHSRVLAGAYRSAVHRRLGRPAKAWVTLQYDLGHVSDGDSTGAYSGRRGHLFVSLHGRSVIYATKASVG